MLTTKQMQRNLKHYMYYYVGAIDGLPGTMTRNAVTSFQREYGLTCDGIYGAKTDRKLVAVIQDCQQAVGVMADGMVGPDTIAAIKSFQTKKGLTADGIIGKRTLEKLNLPGTSKTVDWSRVKYFKKSEFRCDCGGRYCDGFPAEIDPKLVALLEKTRAHYGKPIQITSGVRCKKRNSQLAGSSPVSKHMDGKAADLWIVGTAPNNENLVKWFCRQSSVGYSYTGFGAVHVEVK